MFVGSNIGDADNPQCEFRIRNSIGEHMLQRRNLMNNESRIFYFLIKDTLLKAAAKLILLW